MEAIVDWECEWDAPEPEFVNPVRLDAGADGLDVEARLLFELVIFQGAEVIGACRADFYAGTPAVCCRVARWSQADRVQLDPKGVCAVLARLT